MKPLESSQVATREHRQSCSRRNRPFHLALSLFMVAALAVLFAAPAGAEGPETVQKPKAKKANNKGGQKQGGPKAPDAPRVAPVTGRSYADIVAQSGPARRRAWAPRPIVGVSGQLLVAVVRGRAMTSGDGGATWLQQGPVGSNGDEAVAVGVGPGGTWTCVLRSGIVAESRDSAQTWTTTADLAPMSDILGPRAVEVAGVSAAGAWAVIRGWNEPLPSSALLVGDSTGWKLGTRIAGAAIAAWRSDRIFAAIVGSTVILGGANGEDHARGATLSGASLNDIAFASATQAWIAADGGLVIESRDGGQTWLPRPVLAGQDLDAIGPADGGLTWVVGHAGARGNLSVNQSGRPDWKIALQAPAPLSRPVWTNPGEVLVLDGVGAVWAAKSLTGPWSKRGNLSGVGPKI